jgi:hypothetical protein
MLLKQLTEQVINLEMNYKIKSFIFLFVFVFLLNPIFLFAQTPEIPEDQLIDSPVPTPGLDTLGDQPTPVINVSDLAPTGTPAPSQVNPEREAVAPKADGLQTPAKCKDGNCGMQELIELADEIGRIAIAFTTIVATIMFVYAGFLYITAQGNTEQVHRATGIFKVTVIGFVIILVAYVGVRELLERVAINGLSDIIN